MRSLKLFMAAALVAALVAGPAFAQDAVAPATTDATVATTDTASAPVVKKHHAKKHATAAKKHHKKAKAAASDSVSVK